MVCTAVRPFSHTRQFKKKKNVYVCISNLVVPFAGPRFFFKPVLTLRFLKTQQGFVSTACARLSRRTSTPLQYTTSDTAPHTNQLHTTTKASNPHVPLLPPPPPRVFAPAAAVRDWTHAPRVPIRLPPLVHQIYSILLTLDLI